MNFSVGYARDKDQERWNAFVLSEPMGVTPYHFYQWRRVIHDAYGLASNYVFIEDTSGEMKGILPLFFAKVGCRTVGVALPYCSHAGIASNDYDSRMILLDTAKTICQNMKLRYIELKETSSSPVREGFVTQILKLEDSIPQHWQKVESKCRRAVKKAEKSGLKVIEGGIEYVEKFYTIYQKNMEKLGAPTHPIILFKKAIEEFKGKATLLMVKKNDDIIAGMLIVQCGRVAHDPWTASLHSFHHLFPNDLLYWKAICYAINKSCHIFDFGLSGNDTGLHYFKKKWGTIAIPLLYTRVLPSGQIRIKKNRINVLRYIFNSIWSKVPNKVSRKIGPSIRKHML
ncbi:MAG: GNAT family N-acetyltransferase [Candidatus Omnitrophica bacterium]|nr:GNAT family N-acetyltransferase [Candidatus Omnitrophota bacterium]